jgi:chromosome segregation ATPase
LRLPKQPPARPSDSGSGAPSIKGKAMTDEVETEADPLKKLDPNEYWGGSFERETAGDAEVDAYIRKLEAENTELFAKLGEARAENEWLKNGDDMQRLSRMLAECEAENERLKQKLASSDKHDTDGRRVLYSQLQECIAESERLKEAGDRIYDDWEKVSDRLAKAGAENLRLREALEKIVNTRHGLDDKDIARAALQDGPGSATYNQRWKSKP